MMVGPWLDCLPFLFGLGLAGLVAGLMVGMMGIGGGIVLVPALLGIYAVMAVDPAVRMPSALGTSLTTIIATSIVSARAHHRRGQVDWAVIRAWLWPVIVGAILGALVAKSLKSNVLVALFAVFLCGVAIHLLRSPPGRVIRHGLPAQPWRGVLGGLIGLTSAVMGIGGGTLTVPVMTLCDYPVKRAIGTAAALGFVIAVPGSMAYAVNGWGLAGLPFGSIGYVNVWALVIIAPFTILAAPLGARLVHFLPALWVRRFFGGFLILTAAKMVYSLC